MLLVMNVEACIVAISFAFACDYDIAGSSGDGGVILVQ